MTSSFRTDIQGLRALAVLSVVIYHISPKHLVGGFIGVDIFFVISGYLSPLFSPSFSFFRVSLKVIPSALFIPLFTFQIFTSIQNLDILTQNFRGIRYFIHGHSLLKSNFML